MKESIKAVIKNPAFTCFAAIFLTLYAEYLLFVFSIGGMGAKWYVTCVKCLGDIAFITLIYWLLPNRKKWIYLIIQTLLSIFFIANVWYFRIWNDFLSPISYKLAGNVNGMLMKSISGLISWYDILYILLLAASFIYYFKYSSGALRKAKTLSWPIKWTFIGISIILFLISQTASIITYYHQQTDAWGEVRKSLSSQIRDRLNPAADPANRVMFQREGLVIYLSRSAWTVVDDLFITKSHIDLSDKEISEIDNYINTAVPIADSDTFASNKEKSIILILVESLNSYVIDKEINGHEITPTLNALAKAEGSITALNVRSQIKDGISHDGQLIINTGLLPIDKGVAMMEYGNREYIPSLPRMLPVKNSTVIFADNGRNYRKSDAFQALGFNNIIRNDDFIDEAERIGRDAAMFNKAKTVVQSLSARNDSIPFFLELHTISTHAPFIEKGVEVPEWLKNAKNLDKRELNYFTTINYFDTVLGNFIEFLKETGGWDNTVITVMADHSCFSAMGHLDNPENLQLDYTEIPCAFIAANTGITKEITALVGQVNIFPTILYLMGAMPETGYRGLGRTLLDSQLKSVVDSRGKVWGEASQEEIRRQKDAFRISNLIHRGDYFRPKK